jgi:hypothetical protein
MPVRLLYLVFARLAAWLVLLGAFVGGEGR